MVSICVFLGYILGVQIRLKDLVAFRPDVNYCCRKTQWFTLICAVLAIGSIIFDYITYSVGNMLIATILSLFLSAVMEWGLAKINTSSIALAYILRFFIIFLASFFL